MTWVGSLFQRETIPVLEAAMGFAHQRQLAIQHNIANVNTPDFKRRTLPEDSFQRTLERAIENRRKHHWPEWRIDNTADVRFDGNYPQFARDAHGRDFGPERHDENNVVIEKEMVDLEKNTLYMEALQQLYKNKTSGLKSALRDRVA